jgi:carbon storage regulator
MLVITRKKGQKVTIGNEIEIQVVRISGQTVRFGITAPEHVPIYRQEIYEAIRKDQVTEVVAQIPDESD